MKITNTTTVAMSWVLLWFPFMALGYEVSTHAGMSNAAYDKSILSLATTYDRLGLTGVSDELTKTYFDLADPNLIGRRDGKQFDVDKFPSRLTISKFFSTRAWLMRGAVREDDTSDFVSSLPFAGHFPTDDPYTAFNWP